MVISSGPIHTIVAILILLTLIASPATSIDKDIVSELSFLQSESPTGVIHLSDALLRRVLSLPTPRPFQFLIFFDAKHLHAKQELALATLKSEFSLLSTSFYANNPNHQKSPATRLFFFHIEFQESQASFAQFGVNSLPHIRLIPPTGKDPKTDSIQMDPSDFSRLAESMAEFIESRAKISVGPIARPPAVSQKQIGFTLVVLLISTPFLVKRVIAGKTFLHEKSFWMAGAVFVYFFSVSGAMFNIIRKMPMIMGDRDDPSKTVYFYKGSGMQLGAEGFAVGFLYTIVGLLIAFATHILVRVRSRNVQRVFMVPMLLISFWAVNKVISLDHWKTGYGIHAYWPSSW